ncbi:Ada metal-binding domain-containing protein [Solitalea lacus]|uniref:Ada metal-binding domain-containing protein n=1 Tax=Solitalea lacus TaxID=2911172 RepID=UPI0021044574|nr:Ada metal-binding domain-containing protein [Solitalea lacus]
MIHSGLIRFGGNVKLKIYGMLNCSSGKRMKTEYRVFFNSADEARKAGYRPCGNCLRKEYKLWKNGFIWK